MSRHNSSAEDEEKRNYELVDVSIYKYDINEPPSIECDVKEVLDYTYSTISLRKGKKKRGAFALFKANRPFIEGIFNDVFWLTHLNLFYPTSTREMKFITKKIGKIWEQFCFPFETDTKLDPDIREIFFDAIPYFFTQSIQHTYIKLSHGNPNTTSKQFRLKVCSIVVIIFTSIHRIDSLLEERLGSFFEKAPPTDAYDNIIEPKKDDDNEEISTMIPYEDLSTLIEMTRRKRPINSRWNMSGMSSLISSATNRKTLPYEHDSRILVQYPPENDADWVKLPPLLPPQPKNEKIDLTIDKYDPMKEPRSLLQRSRRPFLASHITYLKSQFQKEQRKQLKIHAKIHNNNMEMRKALLETNKADVNAFLEDLRELQLENKRNETPELVVLDENDNTIKAYKNFRPDSPGPSSERENKLPSSLIANRKANDQKEIEEKAKVKNDNSIEDMVPLFDPTIHLKLDANF
ncbi:hypothetical protein TRFO_21015 [Tritrichomonas foetus]|uniref:Uncharacterized protein n=1 Tax=Tritrichomonas foetus TaxID=1144522 RepID=A0A1J4KFX8_9EUKA|nr:hypothetical protein TRFO_21015 [Tritrichomonas foetus]|eukprot:OHT09930.1 hypothetical protein TRFO_21015 [Tritrichomonas foetus]